MSLVNRMLQDIDRRAAGAAPGGGNTFEDVCVSAPREARAPRPWALLALLTAAIVLGATVAPGWLVGYWNAREDNAAAKPAQPVAVAVPAVAPRTEMPAAAPAAAPMPAAGAEGVAPPAQHAAPETRDANETAIAGAIETMRLSLNLSAPAVASSARQAAPVPAKSKPPEAASTRAASPPAAKPPARPGPPDRTAAAGETASPAGASGPRPVVAVRQVAAAETVATARQQWAEGARSGALATVREALAAADASRDAQAARLLALELARFELASQRPQAALEVLHANAARIGDDPEALALRGNAQQRVGAHAQAAESYLAALRQRPDEGNWMLGAAISLAAEGRTGEAQTLVNRANERGAVTPQVAAYLQQLGIAPRR